MVRSAVVPGQLRYVPFLGRRAVADGLVSRRMLQGAAWRRLLPGVYLHRDAPVDHRTWIDAVSLLLPAGAAIAGLSAAYLWGVDHLPPHAPVTVIQPDRCRPTPHTTVWQRRLAADEVTRFAGVSVTTGLRTAFDLGRRPPVVEALVAVEALLYRRVTTLAALRALAASRPGWPGAAVLREVCALAEPAVESPMETRLRLLLRTAGLPRPAVQHEVRDGSGRFVARLDLAYPRARVGVEYDGDHHRDRTTFRRDVARLNALRAAGWTVLRATADDVRHHPARFLAQVAAVLPRRRTATVGQAARG